MVTTIPGLKDHVNARRTAHLAARLAARIGIGGGAVLSDAVTYPLSGGLTRLSEVEPVEVDWLWEPYIPLGKLTFIEGDPGLGKSWLALAIASALSTGAVLFFLGIGLGKAKE